MFFQILVYLIKFECYAHIKYLHIIPINAKVSKQSSKSSPIICRSQWQLCDNCPSEMSSTQVVTHQCLAIYNSILMRLSRLNCPMISLHAYVKYNVNLCLWLDCNSETIKISFSIYYSYGKRKDSCAFVEMKQTADYCWLLSDFKEWTKLDF